MHHILWPYYNFENDAMVVFIHDTIPFFEELSTSDFKLIPHFYANICNQSMNSTQCYVVVSFYYPIFTEMQSDVSISAILSLLQY